MSIQRISALQRLVSCAIIVSFLTALIDIPAAAGTGSDGAIRVTNQQVRMGKDVALISYDLEAPAGETYLVVLVLLRESEPSFKVIPSNTSGDIGDVRPTGNRRTIRWEYKKDFPAGLHGEDYYFRIEVGRQGGGFPWLWVGLGTAAAAGITAALIGAKSGGSASPGQSQVLPLPPPR